MLDELRDTSSSALNVDAAQQSRRSGRFWGSSVAREPFSSAWSACTGLDPTISTIRQALRADCTKQWPSSCEALLDQL